MKPQSAQVSITAVIVLYQLRPADSITFQTLQKAFAAARLTGLRLQVLLYDNTPGGQDPGALPENVEYFAALQNEGLAAAYNWAIERADENASQWLLTLDQDTDLPETFLQHMTAIATQVANTPSVAAIVPQIIGEGRVLSPNRFRAGALASWFPRGFRGTSKDATYAFNSASLMRISALRQAGGYSPWFWLDNSDAYIFRQFHRYGKRVFVAGEIQVNHNFSMLNMKTRVTASRYHNILLAESAFWDMGMNLAAGWERTARLVLRLAKHLWRKDPAKLSAITVEFIKRRLFWSKRKRLQHWEKETRALFPRLPAYDFQRSSMLGEHGARPMISVCMAAYNGAAYIDLQLQSILRQIEPHDEVVIVDDASTDKTVEIIKSLQNPSIRLIRNEKNCGINATFEDALRNATGDILFLADGDDIWADNKVERFKQTFQQLPQVSLVTSRVAFIDQHGQLIDGDRYDTASFTHANKKILPPGFWSNLLRNHFQGSAMAIRASLLETVLPFPKKVAFLHDHWIGTRNIRAGGTAFCVEEPLLFYRRHAHNVSRPLSRARQLQVRLQLLWAHLVSGTR
ncbi:MAG: glycosyl transferase family 2 [Acidobacteriaceae bacterium]|nr:glycosyl transferase family 2 [Acidobacteriaceae bacterium]